MRGSERGIHWTRWLWLPIVVPALVLAWLAWRSIASERELYLAELLAANQRLVTQQVAGIDARLQARVDDLAARMQEWGSDPDSVWMDPERIVLLGLRRGETGSRLLFGRGLCEDKGPDSSKVKLATSEFLESLQIELMDRIHAPCVETIDTNWLALREKQAAMAWSRSQHWQPLLENLFGALRARAQEAQLWMGDSAGLGAHLDHAGRGLSILRSQDGLCLVMREPLVPRGNGVLLLLDESKLLRKTIQDSLARVEGKRNHWGWRRQGQSGWSSFDGDTLEGMPMATGMLPRAGWEIGIWSERDELRTAARGRTVLLSLVLVLSLGVLLFTAWAAASAVDAQRQLLALKTDFVSNVTHELKTPLTSILMFAELLESGKAQARSQEFGGVIRKEAARLGSLIEGILSVARQEAGMGRPELVEVELRGLAEDLCRSLEPQATSKGVQLMVCGDGPLRIGTDPALLRSILQNLVDNAIKYGRSPGKVQVELEREKDQVRISVLDNGPGIAMDDQKKVFDRFFRGGSGLTRSISGTGLGLSIVRSAVSSLGGKIRLESSPEWGTRVTVTIPERSPGNG